MYLEPSIWQPIIVESETADHTFNLKPLLAFTPKIVTLKRTKQKLRPSVHFLARHNLVLLPPITVLNAQTTLKSLKQLHTNLPSPKMANLKFLPLIFFLTIEPHLSATSSPNDASLIEQTCKHTPHQGLCLQFLRSDPRSSDADVTGLALIMVDAMKAKAKQALAKIHQELQRKGPIEKEALGSCAERYRAVLEADVPEAMAALEKGDPKFAEDGANDAALEANSCERGFSYGKSPLTHENNAVHDVAEVTAAIVRNLL